MEQRDMGYTEEELETIADIERAQASEDAEEAALLLPDLHEDDSIEQFPSDFAPMRKSFCSARMAIPSRMSIC